MLPSKLKIGITLSGGGVRAAVFHLGVLARLADENLLEQVRMSSTVSGGSLVTGLVYQSNGHQWPGSAAFKSKSVPYVKKCLTQRNLQGYALRLMLLRPDRLYKYGRAGAIASEFGR